MHQQWRSDMPEMVGIGMHLCSFFDVRSSICYLLAVVCHVKKASFGMQKNAGCCFRAAGILHVVPVATTTSVRLAVFGSNVGL